MYPQTIVQSLEQHLLYQMEYVGKLQRIKEALQRLGVDDFNDNHAYFSFDPYSSTPKVEITANNQATFDEFKAAITKGMGEKAEWTSTYHEHLAQFFHVAKDFDVEFVLKVGAKPCQVEMVEENVEIAAQPARTEKRKRFVLKGDCPPEPAPVAEPDIMTKVAIAAGALPTEG